MSTGTPSPVAQTMVHQGEVVLSPWKKLAFSVAALALIFVASELVIRIGAYFVYNRSPYFLYYGLSWQPADDQPEGHSVSMRGYSKFEPNRVLQQYGMFAKPTPIRINSSGLRGPDFSAEKPAGVIRIICMGGSSTFGFFDRDEHTYPAELERAFRAGNLPGGATVEVINAGIPHANSDNILAMLRNELLDYRPDILTFYEGYNDATFPMDENALQRTMRWMHAHFASYVALSRAMTAVRGRGLRGRWSGYLSNQDASSVDRQVRLHVERFEGNLREVVRLARAKGVPVVLIKQPITMEYYSEESSWRQKSYALRVNETKARLAAEGFVTGNDTVLLVHSALMDVLDRLAAELNLAVVDNIAIMDQHPEYYASYVHITEAGNRTLAEAIRERLMTMTNSPFTR